MREMVYQVIRYGLTLRDRLKGGEQLNLDEEQARLRGLLAGTSGGPRVEAPSFGMESMNLSRPAISIAGGADRQLTDIQYALVSWLDEIFIFDSPWADLWRDQSLEAELFKSRIRAEKFWEVARRAGGEVLEVCYLCVMLGFRGEMVEKPDELRGWAEAALSQLSNNLGKEISLPAKPDPIINVPPRQAREQMDRMAVVWGAALLVLVPVVVFFVLNWALNR